jgi:hypothetical protein
MKYIVWRTPFKSYEYAQGDGYFVKYKNKCSDEYSPNWFDAGKYKTIGSAITRLGITLNESMKSMDDFFNANEITKSYQRDKTISDILGDDLYHTINFSRGHIDKIDDNGNFIGNAGSDILEYVQKYIESNIKKHFLIDNNLQKRFTSLGVDNYIDKSTSDEDFWNEIYEKNGNKN